MSCYDGFIWLCITVRARLFHGKSKDKKIVKKMSESKKQESSNITWKITKTSQGMNRREKKMPDVQ